ncbi:nucleotidyltransferase domain-containing protein [Faecalibacterium prausnitzii]|uniref:nucleotidyltransferase domain-containing protein n=1 Tax=Faecalibacterium prausnitzii TaxID=853 RepID=UPI002666FDF2|nr:nucleotidyltransferase family protein [Faecalibacterium prausnitzii]
MEKTSEFLIYLMACSLQGTKPEEALLANIDMEALLRLAKAHSVSAMVCMALEQTDAFQYAAETTRLKWLDAKNKAVRKNMLLDAERHQLEKEFAEHGIWYMPLKGSILKDWYPKFGMREMADNDILFDPAGRKQVREIFQNRSYKTVSFRKGNHDVYEKAPIYNFEMHVSLFHGTYKELTEQYENVKERLLPVDGTAYQFAFTPEDFYVFVLAHAHKHYSHSGTGIRTLADIYIMNQKLGGTMNWEYVDSELRGLGIFSYERESRELAQKLFGIAELPTKANLSEAEQQMLAYYLGASTYGTIENRTLNQMQKLQPDGGAITAHTKRKYLLSRIFPGREWCKACAPTVYKYPVLLPFFWVWRLAVKGVKRRDIAKQELEAIKRER